MKTNQSVKASIMAIIMLMVVFASWHPTIVKAQSLKSLKLSFMSNTLMSDKQIVDEQSEKTPLNLDKLEIKPVNEQLHSNVSSLKLEIDVEELKQIKAARKKALELERQRKEEERRKAEEARKAEEKAKADEKAQALTATSGNSLTYDELVAKLNRSLNSTLAGKGDIFAKYATELGIDPYLAVAIVLHETGCKWECSTLLKQCNNVGGMKGSPGCNGGSYKAFSSLDEGISAFMNNLYKNYFAQGLTTPETIGPKYAASSTWASQVRAYMNEIEAK